MILVKNKITHVVFDNDGTLVDTTKVVRSLYPGIKELVEFLKSQNIALYVWTARERRSTVEILKSLDMIQHFDEMSCGIEASQKPSPEGISNMLYDIPAENVAVIGDSVGDMIGAKKFGALPIAALWGHGNTEAIELMKSYGAQEACLTVEECKSILEKRI